MKKYILITLVSVFAASSAFAERELSRLKSIETSSCDNSELQRTVLATADSVLFTEQNLTVLEEGLGITVEEKNNGLHAVVLKAAPRSSVKSYAKTVERANQLADAGRVGITAPAKFDVVYVVKDAQDLRKNAGRITVDVTCRIEMRKINGQDVKMHSAQLINFEVKAKGR